MKLGNDSDDGYHYIKDFDRRFEIKARNAITTGWKVVDNLQVNSLAVAKGYRNRGIGVTLLNAVVALGCELEAVSVFLEVRSSNTVARELYRRLAFNETGHRTDYYAQPVEDAVILCRRLESPRPV